MQDKIDFMCFEGKSGVKMEFYTKLNKIVHGCTTKQHYTHYLTYIPSRAHLIFSARLRNAP